ncbi:MAG: putative bifunctional diguanylate cyclase/phosphodiesterase [Notoacmeibacter sp.]
MLSQIPLRDTDNDIDDVPVIQARRQNDGLTGLPNRKRFIERVDRLIQERRADPAPFALAIIDIIDFRLINDVFGVEAGDEILAQAGLRLRNASFGQTFIARIGGDIFGVLLPLAFHEQAALTATQLLCDLLSAPFDTGGRSMRLATSAGVALYRHHTDTAALLLRNAETALYTAKKRDDCSLLVHDKVMEEESKRIVRIEQALRTAISTASVEVHFQPIISFHRNQIAGFEALARWTDPDLGFVPPDVFIQVAEKRGLISALSRVLFSKALSAMSFWPQEMFLAFNLSPSQLIDNSTAHSIITQIREHGIDPSRIELEVTETAVMANPVVAARAIRELKAAGLRISLDDFGTGQSSLGRLRELPFNKLKIDRAFVSCLIEDKASNTIVNAILAMCNGLGITTVAEGIETREQAAKLIKMGCDAGQGYLFGRPKSARDTEALLRANGHLRAKTTTKAA